MPATYKTARICPYCGRQILLADCDIVATNPEAVTEIRKGLANGELDTGPRGELVRKSNTSVNDDSDAYLHEDDPLEHFRPDSPSSRVRDAAGPSRTGYRDSIRIAPPPPPPPAPPQARGMKRILTVPVDAALPTADELARDVPVIGTAPRRACPNCRTPLPAQIDDRNVFTIVVAGATAGSKSTLLVQLLRPSSTEQFRRAGFAEFVEDEDSPDTLDTLRVQLGTPEWHGTLPARRYEPWIVQATGAGRADPALLFLHDLPGEAFLNRDLRERAAPFLRWSDGVLFLVDPEPYLKDRLQAGFTQARMLQGIVAALPGYTALTVAIAKADLLCIDPASISSEDAQRALHAFGAGAVVEAALSRPGTEFTALAADPGGTGTHDPAGVFEAFHRLAARTDLH